MRKLNVRSAVVLCLLSAVMAGCSDDDDDDEDYEANLTAAQEVPAPTGSPTATGDADIVLEDRVLTVSVVVSGNLTSDVTMAHIHGPADPGEIAGVILDFVPSMTAVIAAGARTGTIVSASFDLDNLAVSPTGILRVEPYLLIEYLNTGRAYVNVHTANNTAGEIRGQISRD